METLIPYGIRILPGLAALTLLLAALPKKAEGLRIVVYIGIFIVIRDAMTPAGLWNFGTEGLFWLRFTGSLPLLFSIAAGSGIVAGIMLIFEPEWRKRIEWLIISKKTGQKRSASKIHTESDTQFPQGKSKAVIGAGKSLGAGLCGAVITAAPLFMIYTTVPIDDRGGAVVPILLIGIAAVSLIGNFYEELLFRGFLQDYLHKQLKVKPVHAAVISGMAFAAGHSFLAVTVTAVGAPLLLFALYEGVIAGLIRMKWGLIPAVLSHGGAIFLLSGAAILI